MKVSLTDAGKRFNRDWVFRHLNYTFEGAGSYAITGPNGSGKSTLLQVLSGAMQASEGSIQFAVGSWQSAVGSGQLGSGSQTTLVAPESVFDYVSICAPYLEVVEEMTLNEFLKFHSHFKPLLPSITIDKIISTIGLDNAVDKQIRYYSSGMKQRVKLAQAIFSDTPFLLLDEPCTNLDEAGVNLYHRLIGEFGKNRLVIVSSNDEVEYSFCQERINIVDYKK
jgi:ABC-type multidrug transport system ATPase subunit